MPAMEGNVKRKEPKQFIVDIPLTILASYGLVALAEELSAMSGIPDQDVEFVAKSVDKLMQAHCVLSGVMEACGYGMEQKDYITKCIQEYLDFRSARMGVTP